MKRIALIGAGAMGANHARVIAESPRARLALVIDPDIARAEAVASHTDARAATSPDAIDSCDAIVIATPTETHLGLGLAMLSRDLPILVEKPVAAKPDDVRRLVDEAARRDLPLMGGFVERFNPVVQAALAALDEPPIHCVALRHSPRTPRITTSVVFDLLIHDIDLALRFSGQRAVAAVESSAWVSPQSGVSEITDCVIRFDDGAIATLSASRVGQRKVRTWSIATSTMLAEVDLLRADLTVYRHVGQELITSAGTTYRAQSIVDIPFVRHQGEPLALQLDRFLDLIEGSADRVSERESLVPPHDLAASVEPT